MTIFDGTALQSNLGDVVKLHHNLISLNNRLPIKTRRLSLVDLTLGVVGISFSAELNLVTYHNYVEHLCFVGPARMGCFCWQGRLPFEIFRLVLVGKKIYSIWLKWDSLLVKLIVFDEV